MAHIRQAFKLVDFGFSFGTADARAYLNLIPSNQAHPTEAVSNELPEGRIGLQRASNKGRALQKVDIFAFGLAVSGICDKFYSIFAPKRCASEVLDYAKCAFAPRPHTACTLQAPRLAIWRKTTASHQPSQGSFFPWRAHLGFGSGCAGRSSWRILRKG